MSSWSRGARSVSITSVSAGEGGAGVGLDHPAALGDEPLRRRVCPTRRPWPSNRSWLGPRPCSVRRRRRRPSTWCTSLLEPLIASTTLADRRDRQTADVQHRLDQADAAHMSIVVLRLVGPRPVAGRQQPLPKGST